MKWNKSKSKIRNPETSTRSEAQILGNRQIPGTSTRSEAEILGNPHIPVTSTRSEAEILAKSSTANVV